MHSQVATTAEGVLQTIKPIKGCFYEFYISGDQLMATEVKPMNIRKTACKKTPGRGFIQSQRPKLQFVHMHDWFYKVLFKQQYKGHAFNDHNLLL